MNNPFNNFLYYGEEVKLDDIKYSLRIGLRASWSGFTLAIL